MVDLGNVVRAFVTPDVIRPDHPAAVYDYTATRERAGPEKFLKNYRGQTTCGLSSPSVIQIPRSFADHQAASKLPSSGWIASSNRRINQANACFNSLPTLSKCASQTQREQSRCTWL